MQVCLWMVAPLLPLQPPWCNHQALHLSGRGAQLQSHPCLSTGSSNLSLLPLRTQAGTRGARKSIRVFAPSSRAPLFISCTSTIHWITAVTAISPELTSATGSWGPGSTSPRPTLRGTAVLTGLVLRAQGVSVDRSQVQCLLLSGPQGSAHHLHLPHAGFWGCGVLW